MGLGFGVWGILVPFSSLDVFLIFHFKHVLRDVGRKYVIDPAFSMDKGFKAQLCL